MQGPHSGFETVEYYEVIMFAIAVTAGLYVVLLALVGDHLMRGLLRWRFRWVPWVCAPLLPLLVCRPLRGLLWQWGS